MMILSRMAERAALCPRSSSEIGVPRYRRPVPLRPGALVPSRSWRHRCTRSHGRLLGDLGEELVVGAERLETIDQQLEAGRRTAVGGEARQDTAQLPHL